MPKPRKGALADAGLTKDDIDGYFCAGDAPGLGPLSMADYMGLTKLQHIDSTDAGGSSYILHVAHAAEAIAAGKCSVALVTLAGKPLTVAGAARGRSRRAPEASFEIALRHRGRELVRHVRDAPHARVRHHQRAAGLDQGRGLAPRAVQRARVPARRRDRRGGASTRR